MHLGAFLDRLFASACAVCRADGGPLCAACLGSARPQRFTVGSIAVEALGEYSGSLRRAILAAKRGRRDVTDALARRLAERFGRRLGAGRLLVPVPTTRKRRGERGFDQAALLAAALGRASGCSVLSALTHAGQEAQHGRNRAARLCARNRFRVRAQGLLEGAATVLVDDVVTTGATLLDCAAALEAAGAVVRGGLVVARTPPGRALTRATTVGRNHFG